MTLVVLAAPMADGLGDAGFNLDSPTFAQQVQQWERVERPVLQRRAIDIRPEDESPRWDQTPILIETSPELANLIGRAEDAVSRSDWKLVVDSLQRVIDDATGSLIPREEGSVKNGRLFESSRRYARRVLSTLPPEGLRAYRMIYDGKARGLLERARDAHDEAILRTLVDRYSLTSVGVQAVDLLSSWLLDEGRAGEALSLLSDMEQISVGGNVPNERLAAKRTAAFVMLGRHQDAHHVLSGFRTSFPDASGSVWLDSVAESVASTRQTRNRPGMAALEAKESPLTLNESSVEISPALLANTPWSYELPGNLESVWDRIYDDSQNGPPQLGLGELLTDGERIFARRLGGVVALWPDDLTPIWDVKLADDQDVAVQTRSADLRMLIGSGASVRTYEDDATRLIAAAQGLVYVVEATGRGEYLGQDPNAPLLPGPLPIVPRNALEGTRLIALDAQTGAVLWQRGRSGVSTDALGNVFFTSVPIVVADKLWVPYLKRNDFHVAILRMSDGALQQDVLLGSVKDMNRLRRYATPLGQGNGRVYVPSAYGTVFALDAANGTLDWAAQYHQHSASIQRFTEGISGWIPGAPISAGGQVLLASPDFGSLLAFSASDGEFLWALESPESSYILATVGDRFWLGGRGASCHSLRDGSLVWQARPAAVPTGRGVLAGETILIPTSKGLASIDAQAGTLIETDPLGPNHMPLGNLLCLEPAVFSLDPGSVRRFPDVARSHQLARARYESDPGDLRAVTQLAWAELLSGNARAACELTDKFVTALEGSGILQDSFRRARMESLLAYADELGSMEESLVLLHRAGEAARLPQHQMRVRLATANQLRSMGRFLEAYRMLVDLGFESNSELTVGLADAVEVSARFNVARRLSALGESLSSEERAIATAELERRVEEAVRGLADDGRTARHELRVISELDPSGSAGQRALLALAEWELKNSRFEWAEKYFQECARREANLSVAAAAHMALCEMYTPRWQNAISLLNPCLDHLSLKFGTLPVPDSGFSIDSQSENREIEVENSAINDAAGVDNSNLPIGPTIAEWVTRRRAAYSHRSMANEIGLAVAAGSASIRLAGDRLWAHGFESGSNTRRLIEFSKESPAANRDCIFLLGSDDILECLQTSGTESGDSSPKMAWQAELRLPGFTKSPAATYREVARPRRAVVDGQTGIFNTSEGLFGVGLLTGRRLWARPYDAPLELDLVPLRDTMIAAGHGFVAGLPRSGRLTLMRSIDGSTVWERDLRGERVAHIWMEGSRILTSDSDLQRLHIFDRTDGRMVASRVFRQPDPQTSRVNLIRSGGVLCGPDSNGRTEAIVGIDIETGEQAWRVEMDKPVYQIFELEPGRIGVGLLGGDVRILNAENGAIILERHYSRGLPIVDGILVDGTLVALAERRQGQLSVPELVAIDVATGEEVWNRTDLTALPEDPGTIRYFGGAIATLIDASRTAVRQTGVAVQRHSMALTMIDVKSGQDSGVTADLPPPSTGARLNRDMAFRPGMIIVGSNRWLHAYRLKPTEIANPEG